MRIKWGVAPKRDAPGAAVTLGDKNLGTNKDRQTILKSVLKRLDSPRGFFGPMPRSSFSPQFDRAGLQIAWKYVYLMRAGRRLTRYVE